MDRSKVKRLYYITDQANVRSILRYGILSHNAAAALPHTDISMGSVQDIRATKRVPNGLLLHDYAPLYFCARNPMLNKRAREMLDELCVLAVDESVLDLEGAVIADHNAAAGIAGFAPSPSGLPTIDEELTFATWWTHDDPWEYERRKKRMCAELLIPGGIHPSFVRGAYLGSNAAATAFENLEAGLPFKIDPSMFFR